MWTAARLDSQALKRKGEISSPLKVTRYKRPKLCSPDDDFIKPLSVNMGDRACPSPHEPFTSWGSTNWWFDIPASSAVTAEDFFAVADCLADDNSTKPEPLEPLKPCRIEDELPKVALQGIAEAAFQAALRVPPQANPFDICPAVLKTESCANQEDSKPAAYDGSDKVYYEEPEDCQILSSISKKACKLLEMVSALNDEMQEKLTPAIAQSIKPVAVGDLVYFAERMIEMQEKFRKDGKPFGVDIGYHYTRSTNMENIRQGGLMTRMERDASKIYSNFNGALHGDGIYTGNNPYAFHAFGRSDIGLLVARLKGRTIESIPYQPYTSATKDLADTGIAGVGIREIVVLRASTQCVALVQFNSSLISKWQADHAGNKAVYEYHCRLQKILDTVFNDGIQTNVPKDTLLEQYSVSRQRCRRNCGQLAMSLLAGSSLPFIGNPPTNNSNLETVDYVAPDQLGGCDPTSSFKEVETFCVPPLECSICLSEMDGQASVVSLTECGHFFHRSCISSALKRSTTCPMCRKPVGKPQGQSPSGKMIITKSQLACAGYSPGTIVIDYKIQAGIQKSYHENPGVPFGGTARKAFLPDNSDGRKLLKRLKFAFSHGLTFTIGTSLTTGRRNSVTWASVHHKTSSAGGAFGFPDPGYFFNCNQELDNLNVPSADDL